MTINTLGNLVKAVERKSGRFNPTPQIARSTVFQCMGNYIGQAQMLAHQIPMDPDDVRRAMGALIWAVAIDARANLTQEKLRLLDDYPLVEEGHPTIADDAGLRDALESTWGTTDVFIERLSGGLFGSYMKALTALKPQARALGCDLSTAADMYVKGL